jgi:hypothetical protein
MISLAPAEVQGVVRTQHAPTRQIQFAFRADPVALDELRLDPTARAAFVLILDNARSRGGRCRLSNGTMGRILGRCSMTISRALGRLQTAGLIVRDLIAGGRVRTGIVVTWEAAQPGRLTEHCTVRRERLTGSTSAPKGVRRERLTDQSPTQSEISDAGRSSLRGEEDPEAAALFASLGPAAYLRAMIAKGKAEAAGKPAPAPTPSEAVKAPQGDPTPPALPYSVPVADRHATAKPAASPATIRREEPRQVPRTAVVPVPMVPASDVMATVRRMVGGLAEGLKAEDVGRRRVGPKRLAAQLAEVRRKHGRSGGREV